MKSLSMVKTKLIADIGLAYSLNSGKSTLLSVLSNAKSCKLSIYNIKTSTWSFEIWTRWFNYKDLPGLISGASQGVGLGLRF